VANANHFDLLNHPVIFAELARWLSEPPSVTTYQEAADA
jgi:hypothetical protein